MSKKRVSTLDAVAELLRRQDAPEVQVAAAVVLGELGEHSKEVEAGLAAMLRSGSTPIVRTALVSLRKIPGASALTDTLPLLAHRDAEVRALAVEAISAVGVSVVAPLRARLERAEGDERRAIDAVLARFGEAREAVSTLLSGLESSKPDIARAVAAEVRPRIREADKKTRTLWLGELRKVLDRLAEKPPASPIPMAMAVKILGYLDDERAVELLLAYANDRHASFAVRQEALIALRFAVAFESHAADVLDTLTKAAEGEDRMLAQAALMSLAALELPRKHAGRIARIATHGDLERATIAIEKLRRTEGAEATSVLVSLLGGERKRSALALEALEQRPDALPALVDAFVEAKSPELAEGLRSALRGKAKQLTPNQRRKLVETAAARATAGELSTPHVDAAREADPSGLAKALAEVEKTLSRKKSVAGAHRAVLQVLARGERASEEHALKLLRLLLAESPRDENRDARARDPALRFAEELADRGIDVGDALRKDKALEPEQLYHVGFHFADVGHPLGNELLTELVKRAGRTKLGKMARNKLGLSGREAD